ncbi:MAG: 30S ribosomal protein S19e [Candidatus Aenigmatarchaeota archaeon]|nr:30S ribosomal protein S19e [Nanoarchaeota archaeon]
MVSINDVDSEKLIMSLAASMEKMEEFKAPVWSSFVKTGVHKERPPTQKNWWWIRTASVLRRVSLNQNVGVSRLRKHYGGRKNLGHKPEHKRPASGAIIRKILQQLEAAGFVENEKKKGRKITKKGQSFLNQAAKAVK